MPRPVQVRTDYGSDTGFFVRFRSAVSKDMRQPDRWRDDMAKALGTVIQLCCEADQRNVAAKAAQRKPFKVEGEEVEASKPVRKKMPKVAK